MLSFNYCQIFSTSAQGGSPGFPDRTLEMNTLTIMDQAFLTAVSPDHSSPTLRLRVNESFTVLAGGLLKCKWLYITANTIAIESSGKVSVLGTGHSPKQGTGSTAGNLHSINCFN